MIKVDLNCDLGESFGAYKMGMDDKVISRYRNRRPSGISGSYGIWPQKHERIA